MSRDMDGVGKVVIEGTKATLQDIGEKANQVSAWWGGYLKRNPKADAAIATIGTTLTDIQSRLEDMGRQVTGEAALAQANFLRDEQRRYNDVLATRLAEALDRIEVLEKRLAAVEARK